MIAPVQQKNQNSGGSRVSHVRTAPEEGLGSSDLMDGLLESARKIVIEKPATSLVVAAVAGGLFAWLTSTRK